MNHKKVLSTEASTEQTDVGAFTLQAFKNKNLKVGERSHSLLTLCIYLLIAILSDLEKFAFLEE